MTHTFLCIECAKKYQPDPVGPECKITMELQDKILYEVKCKAEHTTYTLIQNHKFEILFEIGLKSLADRNYTGAISNFQSALERFYEFSIFYFLCRKVVIEGKGLDKTGYERLIKTWKPMSKQSERQLGAFYALYFNEFDEPPPLFNQEHFKKYGVAIKGEPDPVAFRNSVIHNGYIPKYEQAVRYGEAVNKYIHELTRKYVLHDRQRVSDVTSINYHKAWDEHGKKENPSSYTGLTLFIGVVQPSYMDGEPTILKRFPLNN